MTRLQVVVTLLRYHIALISVAATLVFGWIFTGRYLVAVALVGGLDQVLINLINRGTDLDEDLANKIPHTRWIVERKGLVVYGGLGVLVASLVVSHLLTPELTIPRLMLHALGLGYNFPLLPSGSGWRRLKQLYLVKNSMSALGFVFTCFVYPLSLVGYAPPCGWAMVATMAVFFLPLELTYEIIYDVRDVEGDRKLGLPTIPIVHGPDGTRRIIAGLLWCSAAVLVAGALLGAIGLRELIMLGAPLHQWLLARRLLARGTGPKECIMLTHLGTAQLAFYLLSTWLWLRSGLPPNLFLWG